MKAGRDFLQAEALKQYDERRAKDSMKPLGPPSDAELAAKDASAEAEAAADAAAAPPADGMMAGVVPGVKPPEDEKKKMLPVTTFGRYVKILLSSNEFLFVS